MPNRTTVIGKDKYLGPITDDRIELLPESEAEKPVVDFDGGQNGDEYPQVHEIPNGRVIVLGESEVRTYSPVARVRRSEGRFLRCLIIREYGGKREIRIHADRFEDWLMRQRGQEPDGDDSTCQYCGFEAVNRRGLSSHQSAKHTTPRG